MALTVLQAATHARAFLKAEAGYASVEEVRIANTINSLIAAYYRWHWNVSAAANIGLTTPTQDYSMAAGDQNKVLYIQGAHLTDATTTYSALLVNDSIVLPATATTGRPIALGLISPTQVRFWPAPNGTFTLIWRYHKRPTAFTVNTESFDMPAGLDEAVKTGMIWQFLIYADDTRAIDFEKAFYAQLENAKTIERRTMNRVR